MGLIDNTTSAVKVSIGTTAQRPTGAAGLVRYNSNTNVIEFYSNTAIGAGWVGIGVQDGSSQSSAAPSGYYIKQNYPGSTSGTYWIKPASAVNAIQMYVDMSTDGGGYDMYPCTGCTATSYRTDGTGSCPTGTDFVIGRTRNHWSLLINRYGTGYLNNCGAVYKTGGGGNYTGCIMRDPTSYGSGCSDWRVSDGGKWWLRDTTHSEPNGDYNAYGWLSIYGSTGAGSDIGMNDGGAMSTGANYVCSTNAKP